MFNSRKNYGQTVNLWVGIFLVMKSSMSNIKNKYRMGYYFSYFLITQNIMSSTLVVKYSNGSIHVQFKKKYKIETQLFWKYTCKFCLVNLVW